MASEVEYHNQQGDAADLITEYIDRTETIMDEFIENLDDCHIDDDALDSSGEQNNRRGDSFDETELPSVIIVTGVPDVVFDSDEARAQFESVFLEFESTAQFYYLKSFRRARILYRSSMSATAARVHVNERDLYGSTIRCFFAQPVDTSAQLSYAPYLLPPKPDKQFLISPPSSPPIGWEPCDEKHPGINFDLLSAITNLAPGEAHELHAPTESHPAIVVHVCEDPEGFKGRPAILQTRRPVPDV